MPLLDSGKIVGDRYVSVGDDETLPESAPAIVSLARLARDSDSLAGRNAPLGVILPPGTDPADVAPYLDRLALIVVPFPKFKDGRSFTAARTLRERYSYAGEIRATGHLLPDQYVFALRCGVSTVEIPEGSDAGRWEEALGHYHIAYQAAVTDDQPLSQLRRHIAVAEGR